MLVHGIQFSQLICDWSNLRCWTAPSKLLTLLWHRTTTIHRELIDKGDGTCGVTFDPQTNGSIRLMNWKCNHLCIQWLLQLFSWYHVSLLVPKQFSGGCEAKKVQNSCLYLFLHMACICTLCLQHKVCFLIFSFHCHRVDGLGCFTQTASTTLSDASGVAISYFTYESFVIITCKPSSMWCL